MHATNFFGVLQVKNHIATDPHGTTKNEPSWWCVTPITKNELFFNTKFTTSPRIVWHIIIFGPEHRRLGVPGLVDVDISKTVLYNKYEDK